MTTPFVLFDLDGTLCDSSKVNWRAAEPLSACAPHWDAIVRVRDLIASGVNCGILTARHEVRHWGPTWASLKEWFGDDANRLDVYMLREDLRGLTSKEFKHTVWAFKTEELLEWGPVAYIGDQDFDRSSAESAGVPFMWASEFRAGQPVPGLDHHRGAEGAILARAGMVDA